MDGGLQNGLRPGEIIADERRREDEKLIFAERRGAELADEFTRLEVQIATVLIAFVGLFFESFQDGLEGYGAGTALTLQWFYAGIIVSVIGSLVMGLIHLKRKEGWWDEAHCERVAILKAWNEAAEGKTTSVEDARTAVKAIKSARTSEIVHSPMWTWIVQTILLGVGIALILVLFLALIFI